MEDTKLDYHSKYIALELSCKDAITSIHHVHTTREKTGGEKSIQSIFASIP